MEFKEFPQLQEKLYFEELENGLKVYLLPKPGFNKSFATFTTKYGSIDNEFGSDWAIRNETCSRWNCSFPRT